MPHFMAQVSYTPESWAAQVKSPQDRAAQITAIASSAGIRVDSFYYAFGEFDAVIIGEAPDLTTEASLLIAAAAGGAVSKIQTTVLMSPDEGLEAIEKAGKIGYRPPASQ